MIRTSATHPIRVDWLPGFGHGGIGMTFAPGKHSDSIYGSGRWERSLGEDLDRLVSVKLANVLVCLLEEHELNTLKIPRLVGEAEARQLSVRRFPIPDGAVPPDIAPVRELVHEILDHVEHDRRVVIHCAGGLGRTGTIAGCVLVQRGLTPADAIEVLHRVRGDTKCPETREQERFIQAFAEVR